VNFVGRWSEKTEIGTGRFIAWLDIAASKFYDWRERYGKANEHNGWVPRDFWLEEWEKQAIIGFHLKNPLEGYRLTFMMLDADIVAASPASVWRVLGQPDFCPSGTANRQRRVRALSSRWRSPTLAYRRLVHQHQRNLLLPVQRSGRLQPLHRELGSG